MEVSSPAACWKLTLRKQFQADSSQSETVPPCTFALTAVPAVDAISALHKEADPLEAR
jgi:hypothetical protein